MAFTTANFDTDSAAENLASVYSFVTEAIGDWFDTVDSTTTENVITFTKGEINVLLLRFLSASAETNSIMQWTLPNGGTTNTLTGHKNNYWSNGFKWVKGWKGSNGIFLQNNSSDCSLFITKSTDDTLIFAGKGTKSDWCNSYYSGSSGTIFYGYMYADIEKDTAFTTKGTGYSDQSSSPITNFYSYACATAGKTSLAPLATQAGTYSENLFICPCSQFAGSNGVEFEADGTRYVTDGLFALKE